MQSKALSQHRRARLASHTPGRLRLKLHPSTLRLFPDVMDEIKRGLEAKDGVYRVVLNPVTRSVTVEYDHGRYSHTDILGLLEDLDVIVESTEQMASSVEEAVPEAGAHVESPKDFIAAINDLNARILAATGVPVNLKIVLPLLFVGAGVWSIGKKGLMIESVPGWLFLWFAFDTFVKLHPSRR